MKNPIKTYSFWFKITAGALLLVLGIWIIFDRQLGETLVMGFTGAIVLIYAIIRVYPLIKTIKSKNARLTSIIEIFIDLILGGIIFAGALASNGENSNGNFALFMNTNYKYFLGAVLYIRGLVYFICTILFKEETDVTKFWVHIAIMTLGAIVVALDGFTATKLALVLAIISLICSLALIVEGGFNYNNYRRAVSGPKKEKVKNVDKNIEAPGKNKEDKIDPENETIIIDKKDEPTDRPFIN